MGLRVQNLSAGSDFGSKSHETVAVWVCRGRRGMRLSAVEDYLRPLAIITCVFVGSYCST